MAVWRFNRRRVGLTVAEMVIFAMLGAMMFATTYVLQTLPNVHLLGLFIVTFTVVYRWRALYPIYIFVFLYGLWWGFPPSWLPYLYVWALLWGAVMLLPRHMPTPVAAVVYPAVSALHGCLFGVLYAPVQAMIYGYDADMTLAWLLTGLPYDAIHGVSNLISGLLILPLVALLRRLNGTLHRSHRPLS